jgi:hypothetical protein
MAHDPGSPSHRPRPDDDLGQPILELAELVEEAPSGFLSRLRNALQRRSLASQIATFSWGALGGVFLEIFRLFFSLAQAGDSTKGGSD